MNIMRKEPEIFISYDHRDREYVKKLSEIMDEVGLNARTDFDLPFGADFYQYMNSAVKECFVALLVISNNYVENESWARREMVDLMAQYVKGRMLIIPLLIDDLASTEILPFGLQTVKYINNSDRNCEHLRMQLEVLKHQILSETGWIASPKWFRDKPQDPPEGLERRIRVQVTNLCNFKNASGGCPWCHWDEFDEENISNQATKVISILKNLKLDATDSSIYPRPFMEFTFTGGEPLDDPENLRQFLDLCSEDGYLITNGIKLGEEQILEMLEQSKLKNVRISYHPDLFEEGREVILDGIRSLLERTNISVRFNHVLPLNSNDIESFAREVEGFIRTIYDNFESYIGNRVEGIAFIEPFYIKEVPDGFTKEADIFDVADSWATAQFLKELDSRNYPPRKKSYISREGLKIEFVKVNCDVKPDYIKRCLACAVEKDICLTIDGRIRICSGWAPNDMKPRYNYSHFSEFSPLTSISGAIRGKYGTVGFYTHFPLLIQIIQKKDLDTVPGFFKECKLNRSEFIGLFQRLWSHKLIEDHKLMPSQKDFGNGDWVTCLRKVTRLVLKENGPFVRIYYEGNCSMDKHERSIELCGYLIATAYELANRLGECLDETLQHAFLTTLLLLEYLSVDESLFSTGRTILAQGISTDLLKWIGDREISEYVTANAIYCLGAIAMENTNPFTIKDFVENLATVKLIKSAPQIQYLLGCIYDNNEEAAKAFRLSAKLAKEEAERVEKRVSNRFKSPFDWIYLELQAEAQRSLGATLKYDKNKAAECEEAFAKADYLSIIHDTKLRYHALFSDGYAAMRRYISGGGEEDRWEALRNFNDSLILNPSFYACLIRMAILEISLDIKSKARTHLLRARSSFSDKGLLTDQEFLNSLLCDLALAVVDSTTVSDELIPDVRYSGIDLCLRIRAKDVECVRNDAKFLLDIFEEDESIQMDNARKRKIRDMLSIYIEECNKLSSKLRANRELGISADPGQT